MRKLTVLGSTGSVGAATLDVVKSNPGLFDIHALTANTNVALLAEQAREVGAAIAVIRDESHYEQLKDLLAGSGVEAACGHATLMGAAAENVDCTMAAIVGMAGLEPLMAALQNGNNVAIANKEPLVSAGALIMDTARKSGATILPVDSEHNAIFQVFERHNAKSISRIILTASGGPFREWDRDRMRAATPEQALAHPNWSMGAKISIDSATMMNKALEVIEAHHLFSLPPDKIEVLLHPQSTVHSMVEYADGSVLAQMGAPDMRVPISHALGWPDRLTNTAQRLDFTAISSLTFAEVDHRRFPAINFAYRCLTEGAAACIAFNAANEIAVEAFLKGNIGFLDVFETVRETVENASLTDADDLQSILAFDANMRNAAQTCILNRHLKNRKAS